MGVATAIAAAVGTGVAIYGAADARRDQKKARHQAKNQEFEQMEFQRKVREDEERTESQRGMIAARARQRAMSAWGTGQALGGGASGTGAGGKTMLGM